jgi:hypothetical protein
LFIVGIPPLQRGPVIAELLFAQHPRDQQHADTGPDCELGAMERS